MKEYYRFRMINTLQVKNLVTLEHLELSKHFVYPEEEHLFSEFTYVDSGSLICKVNGSEILLQQGDFYLTTPHTPHSYSTHNASTVLVVCFECTSDVQNIIRGKTTLDVDDRKIISNIIAEAKTCFKFPFNQKLHLLDKPTFASMQMIKIYIEQLLIIQIRKRLHVMPKIKFVMNSAELENTLANDIIALLKDNLNAALTLDNLCHKFFYSKTFINRTLKKTTGYTFKQYYTLLKIIKAKEMLKKNMSITDISNALAFDNPNYFTKVFIKYTEMTPSQFKKTII